MSFCSNMTHSVACQQFPNVCIHLLNFFKMPVDNIKTIPYQMNSKWVSLCGPALRAKLSFTDCPHVTEAFLPNLLFHAGVLDAMALLYYKVLNISSSFSFFIIEPRFNLILVFLTHFCS